MHSSNKALEFAVVGLGQAGGNLAAEFYHRGYNAIAVNTAQTDLKSLSPGGLYPPLPNENQLYIGLENCDGAGSDAEYAAECIQVNRERIIQEVEQISQGIDGLFLAAGLGGGTGSAAGELIEVLQELQLPIVGLFTLPNDAESAVCKINAIRAASRIVDAPLAGRVFIDNASVEETTGDTSITQFYPKINAKIIEPIDALNRLNHREDLRAVRSFDGEDFRKLLLSSGILNYGIIDLPNITLDEVVGALSDSLASSELMPPGFTMEHLSFVGLIIEAPAEILAETPGETFHKIDERLKDETRGGVVYRGIYQTSGDTTRLRIMASSQELPERISQVLNAAKSEGSVLQEKLNSQLPQVQLEEVESFLLFPEQSKNRASERPRAASNLPAPAAPNSSLSPRTPPETSKNVRKNPSRRRPAPNKRRAAERRPSKTESNEAQEPRTKEGPTDSINFRDNVPPGSTKQGVLIDSEENAAKYDQLVADYLHAKKRSRRVEIAEQLEKDSISAHTVIRYHAVDAMCRLGANEFKDALLAASEDENDSIRTLAIEALSS